MFEDFKQLVPSDVCLSCDGCCRFKNEKSIWRPKVAQEEITQPQRRDLPDNKILSQETLDKDSYAKTVTCGQQNICQFFSSKDNTCRIYEFRPFECRLYPILLVKDKDKINVVAHQLCPFIRENQNSRQFTDYVDYLRGFLIRAEVADFIKRNHSLVGDYKDNQHEFRHLFALDLDRSFLFEDLLNKRDMIESFIRKSRHDLSSFSFINLLAWKDFFDFDLKIIDENLCIFAKSSLGCFLYLPPLGSRISSKAIEECFRIMKTINGRNSISRIENVEESQLLYFAPNKYTFLKKTDEYFFKREDIIPLKGKRFKSKRNAYNHFVKNYNAQFSPYLESMQKECEGLYEAWMEKRARTYSDDVYQEMLKENRVVHKLVLQRYKALDLIGRVVVIDGQIKSYTFGYPLEENIFCILFEIADLDKKGLAVYTFRKFCADHKVQPFDYINTMDDFGMDNIKRTKLSFRPCRIAGSYTVSQRPN